MTATVSRGRAVKVLKNGSIYGFPAADAVVLATDRILAVGAADEVAGRWPESVDVEYVDLAGRFVLPGFVDAHIHLLHTGLVQSGWRIDLTNMSRADTLETLAQAAKDRRGEWVVGYGWDESRWQDRRYLERAELDAVTSGSPVLAIRMDGHLLVANSAALAHVPDTAPDDLVERDPGWLREDAVTEMRRIIRPDHEAAVEALDAAAALCHRLGITTVHTMTQLDFFEAFLTRRRERRLRVTVCPGIDSLEKLSEVGLRTGFGDSWVRFGGLKIFADGSIGAGNAAVSVPYRSGGLGRLNHEDAQLRQWVESADQAGWQTLIHAIGDRAIEQVLQTHESVRPDPSLRHRIEHVELPLPLQLERMRAAGLYLSMQPNFTANWSGPDSMYDERLGTARDEGSNPLLSVYEAGIPLAFGSDGMPPSPLYGLHGAINGPYPRQRLPFDVALDAYTAGGALFGFEEEEKGSLEPGKLADIVVLDEDPRLHPDHVRNRRIEMTFVGGELVYTASPPNGSSKE
jgi:predicted amidohydrolase YtcJ